MSEIELIPAINADSFEEISQKIRLLERLAKKFAIKYVHIDAADGTFTENSIWHEPKDLAGFKTNLKIEVHLMLADIDRRIADWLFKPISRIIFHVEASRGPRLAVQKCAEAGIEVGLAANPQTRIEAISPFLDVFGFIQILGVQPGFSGQKIKPEIVNKIRDLRKICPECIIEVDGGVNTGNAGELERAGADILAAASAIFGKSDPEAAIAELKSKTNYVKL